MRRVSGLSFRQRLRQWLAVYLEEREVLAGNGSSLLDGWDLCGFSDFGVEAVSFEAQRHGVWLPALTARALEERLLQRAGPLELDELVTEVLRWAGLEAEAARVSH